MPLFLWRVMIEADNLEFGEKQQMIREVTLEEISDGKLYEYNDMVKADCFGCQGCSQCCHGMGESILLDPLDIHRLTSNLDVTFEELLEKHIELHVVDGMILPNLKMDGSKDACTFLNEEGRCTIHGFRPGICRIFPLGRYYENRSFKYFLQVHECPKENKGKIKVRKWIDTPEIKDYEAFVSAWHYFLLDLQEMLKDAPEDARRKTYTMYVLQNFYGKPFLKEEDFYSQFWKRLEQAKQVTGIWNGDC